MDKAIQWYTYACSRGVRPIVAYYGKCVIEEWSAARDHEMTDEDLSEMAGFALRDPERAFKHWIAVSRPKPWLYGDDIDEMYGDYERQIRGGSGPGPAR